MPALLADSQEMELMEEEQLAELLREEPRAETRERRKTEAGSG